MYKPSFIILLLLALSCYPSGATWAIPSNKKTKSRKKVASTQKNSPRTKSPTKPKKASSKVIEKKKKVLTQSKEVPQKKKPVTGEPKNKKNNPKLSPEKQTDTDKKEKKPLVYPIDDQGLYNSVRKAIRSSRLEEAEQLVEWALKHKMFKSSLTTQYCKGLVFARKAKKERSIDSDGKAYLDIAIEAYNRVLNSKESQVTYRQFIKNNLSEIWAEHLTRGIRYLKKEAFDRAIQNFEICQSVDPDNFYAFLYMAIAAHRAENYLLAQEQYEAYFKKTESETTNNTATKKTKENGEMNFLPKKNKKQIKEQKKKDLRNISVYSALAHIAVASLKDYNHALQNIDQGLAINPYHLDLLHQRFGLLCALEQVEQAVQKLQIDILKNSKDPQLHFRLAHLLEELGRVKEARETYYLASTFTEKPIFEIQYKVGILCYNEGVRLMKKIEDMEEDEFQEKGEEVFLAIKSYLKYAKEALEKAKKVNKSNKLVRDTLKKAKKYLRKARIKTIQIDRTDLLDTKEERKKKTSSDRVKKETHKDDPAVEKKEPLSEPTPQRAQAPNAPKTTTQTQGDKAKSKKDTPSLPSSKKKPTPPVKVAPKKSTR